MLPDGNLRALLTFRGKMLNVVVDHLANRRKEFDTRIREMLFHRGRNAQVIALTINLRYLVCGAALPQKNQRE
jgi:hypothetical protein